MFGLGFGEILIICLFLLIFIGPKKLPELARGLGKGIREFQKASADLKDQVMNPTSQEDQSPASIASQADQDQTSEVVAQTQDQTSMEAQTKSEEESSGTAKS